MAITKETVQDVLIERALRCRGPGGAIAVVKDGELIGQHVWGLADLENRIPMTVETQMPICSITKQFVCALLLDLERNPTPALAAKGSVREQLTAHLTEILSPELTRDGELTIERLCDMQSGLRDYWAMTTLWGSKPDDEFLIARDSAPMLAQTKSFQFQPGTEYSYCNVNFHILARVIERATGESLDKLLEERILRPAGMSTAFLCPNTAQHPPPCVGYEGDEEHGFTPAVNRMEWSGDAGLVASLTDMIAYEKYIDRCYADPESWYNTAIADPKFSDGTTARYRYGLSHADINEVHTIGHGGALRGYRLHRRHSPKDRLSVVVMLNSDADAYGPTIKIFRDLLELPIRGLIPREVDMYWNGVYLDPDTQLSIAVVPTNGAIDGELDIKYDGSATRFKLDEATWGKSDSMSGSIDTNTLTINRLADNRTLNARRILPKDSALKDPSFLGVYQGVEIESTFHCIGGDGMLYGAFDGYLGKGNTTPMKHLGEDVWVLTCPRGLDAPAPGDWTMVFSRDENDQIKGFTIGCWLARKIEFVKKA
ncbi:Peptidase S12, aminopeptidase DmpB, domain C [Penicillium griseofulvum]|uniref:Peptidase S12, aminopeptidase DmpB, domain C n=1 Tax=Penicillium patulum TaxID=5078 RepID=A0A135LBB3_PENPA|nr:Peptidase S12, aminopeptidase DmpB, domain C [Penicillium griseofulvum]KXG46268.1 Peptidase S12, aminopeptidase DmpB, domain C [Penicillium griseofulvum]